MEHIPSHDFPVEQGNSVFLLKYGANFKKKKKKEAFHCRQEDRIFGENLWRGRCLHDETNDQIMSSVGNVTNAFSSNLSTINLNIFLNHGGI